MLNSRPRAAALLLVIAAVLLAAPSAQATDYYADVSGGNWTSSTTWHLVSNSGPAAPAGTYPGSAAGDKAIIDFQGIAISLSAAVPNAVIVDFNNVSCSLTVSAGGSLPMTGSSQIAGGTILNLNGGTISNAGILTIASGSSISWNSGTITGIGSTSIAAGAVVNATGSGMTLTGGQNLNITGDFVYGPSATGFAVNSGASVQILNTGDFDIQNANGINSDNVGGANITVNTGGTFRKTADDFGTNIDPILNNNGLVQTNVNVLVLNDGTHTGTFNMNGAATGIVLLNTPVLNGATITGTGTASLDNTTISGTVNATNVAIDGFGSLSGGGTMNVSGTFTWAGGSISGIIFNAQLGSTVSITGAAATSLQSAAHFTNSGTMTVNPGNTFAIESDAHLTNNGTLNLAGDVTISSDGAPLARIDNLATRSINKTAGAAAAYVGVKVNNAGSVSSLSGPLKLQQGGTHTGSWGIGTSAAIVFDGGTHQFTGGTFTGSTGTVGLNAGTMDVDANMVIPNGITFQQSGGTLTGSGNFTVNGGFLWTGGFMSNASGNGQTVLTGSTSQISGTTSTIALSGRTLSNSGTFTYNPTPGIELSIDDGGTFSNTGSFNILGDPEIDSNQSGNPTFSNTIGGAINKNSGTGSTDIYANFTSSAVINLNSGSLALHGGGQNLGTVNFNTAANKIIVANGTFNLTTQPGLNGSGWISVDGPFATLGLAGAITFPRLEILSGGTVSGGTLGISSTLLWRQGKMLGGVTNIGVGATVDATSLTGTITLDSHSLTNNGTFTWDGTTHSLQLINGSSLINNATFTATGSGNLLGTPPANAITNNGTFEKTGGASGTRIDPTFSNSGQLSSEVAGQSLILNGGGSQTGGGSLVTVAGAFIDIFGGTYSVPPGTSPFMGSGIFRVNGGTLAITGSLSVPSPAILRVDSGTLNVAVSSTFQTFGGFQWNGGTLAGNGTTRTTGGSHGNVSPTLLTDNHTLSIAGGTFNYNGVNPNALTIGSTAAFNVESGATLAMGTGTTINGTSTDGLTVTGGTLDVSANNVTIATNGSLSGGVIATGASGLVSFSAGTFVISSGAPAVTGTGTIGLINTGALTVNSTQTFPNLTMLAGTLNGTGGLTVNGGDWSGGTMSGTGTTTIGGPFAINTGSVKTLGRNLTNASTITENDGLTFTGTAVLANTGTWNSLANLAMTCSGCSGAFHNTGTYTKGGNFVTHTVPFNNDGPFAINAGAQGLSLGAGGTHSGDFATATGNLHLGGTHTFNATSDITGNGNVQILDTTVLQGTLVLGDNGINFLGVAPGASLTINTTAPVSVPRVNIAGNIGGSANLNIDGPGSNGGSWTDGTISGGGASSVNLAAGVVLGISGAGAKTLDGRTFVNNGTLNLGSSLGAANGAAFTNNSSFRHTGTASTFSPVYTTSGNTELLSGNVDFAGGFTQTAGMTKLGGGTMSSPSTVNLNGGTLVGNGSIAANVNSSGTIAPGLSAGQITVTGNLTLNAASVVNIEIAGTTPATQYDRLAVTGAATLNGTLNVAFISGFTPADNDVFDVVTWGSRTGTFGTVNLPPFPAGTFTGTYEPSAFRIAADFVGDLEIEKTGPPTAAFGSNVTFTITVTNNGPSPADGVIVTDTAPAELTFVSNSGDCTTAFPCSLGTIAANTSKTINATFMVSGGAGTNVTNSASVSTTSTDNVGGNNIASHTVFVELSDLAITKSGPPRALPGSEITFVISVANGGASSAGNVVVNDPTPGGLTFLGNTGACTTPFPCSLGTMASGTTKTINAKYSISGTLAGSNVTNTATVTTTTADDTTNNTATATVQIDCLNSEPTGLSPNTTAGANGTLSWRGRGDSYIVYFGPAGSGCSTQFATTSSTSVPYSNLTPGQTYEFRVESIVAGCRTLSSECVRFTVPVDCTISPAPVARVVGQTTSSKTYTVEWDAVPGATHYIIDEALGPDFLGSTRLTVNGTSQSFKHEVTAVPTAYYYRVFAFVACVATPGPASSTVRVVIIPLPPKEQKNPKVNVPAGSTEIIVQEVFVPGEPGQNLFFTAATDRPWLSVRPEQGVLPPSGVTFEVFADPKTLPNGTFTASVVVTITDGTSNIATHGVTTVTTPMSVNLVTPVTPVSGKPAASQHALIIPTAGHLGGIDSQWQSDIRVTNAGFKSARYKLTFTPSGGTALGVKETTITVDAGATTALDDIISNWFGLGTLGDGVNGMLEILPLDDPANTIQSTVASSRTYNVSGNGTLGQYIPAVPFPNFIGRPSSNNAIPQTLSLQQIAQNSLFRTNVGIAEAAGAPANALIKVFNASGTKLTEIPLTLAAGEQRQMNQLLAQHGIELADGRIEVQVTGGEGKVTAYASVVDSATQDPLLVSGQLLGGAGSTKFVLPGVANLNNSLAQWRTDMRVFNSATSSQPATLTFYPFNNGASKSANVLLGAGQVLTLDNILKTQFDIENAGGVVHLTTPNAASLVVTGRTYNQTENGTFGQYVPAVTPDQAVGLGGRTLHILQVEDSTRYRTNVGLAEVNGRPATVEMQIVLPDSKITPTVEIPLAANEFRQFNVIRELGLGNVYNARITVRVKSGDGRVTAYGSVIDELTQDPTYVPAQ